MNLNHMNSMDIYNNIHYQPLTTQRSFDTYAQNLSKSINNNNNTSNSNVNNRNSEAKYNYFPRMIDCKTCLSRSHKHKNT